MFFSFPFLAACGRFSANFSSGLIGSGFHPPSLPVLGDVSASLLKDINTAGIGSSLLSPIAVGGNFYFSTSDALWKSDGTEAGTEVGTVRLKDINSGDGSWPRQLFVHDGMLYFTAVDDLHGEELWKSDGAEAGTMMVKEIDPWGDSGVGHFVSFEGTLYFAAYDEESESYALWKTDGTMTGTAIVHEQVDSGADVAAVGDTLYLSADDGVHGWELWVLQ